MFDIPFINKPLGYVMQFLSDLFGGNFAAAVLVFTILINIIMIPLSLKSQKSSVQQTRIKPKLDELKKRYGDDKQKYNVAMQKLYQEEKVSMSGGCLPMLVRLVIMMCIYNLILSPVTYMVGVEDKKVENVQNKIYEQMVDLEKSDKKKFDKISNEINWDAARFKSYELGLIKIIDNNEDIVKEIMGNKYNTIAEDYEAIVKQTKKSELDFKLFGSEDLVLYNTPDFTFNFAKAQLLWIIPFGAFLAQILTSVLSMAIQKRNNPDAPSMAFMMFTMPLISLFIGFGLPGGVGFYWICSSLVGGLIQAALQYYYDPHKMLAKERAKELNTRGTFEIKQIEKFSNTTDTDE